MKKFYFGVFLVLVSYLTNAQDYGHWSLDLGAGIHRVGSPISAGTNPSDLGQGNFGVRYMFNERFGLRLNLGYNSFSESSGNPFKSNYYRASVENVVNIGNVLNFDSWTDNFNLLVYAGVGAASLNVIEPEDNGGDGMTVVNFGVTPQYKLSEGISIFLDFSSIINFGQEDNINGGVNLALRESNVSIYNTSLGFNIALGKNKKLAEFSEEIKLDDTLIDSEIAMLKERLAKAEKEIAELKNKEVIPNKESLITELDEKYITKEEFGKYVDKIKETSNTNFIKSLFNNGYINIYFDTNKSTIQEGSLGLVNYLRQFMLENPTINAELIGYSDETGTEENNMKLSQNRSKTVFDVLVAAGIKASRLSYVAGGEDKSVSKGARQLARKVSFKLK